MIDYVIVGQDVPVAGDNDPARGALFLGNAHPAWIHPALLEEAPGIDSTERREAFEVFIAEVQGRLGFGSDLDLHDGGGGLLDDWGEARRHLSGAVHGTGIDGDFGDRTLRAFGRFHRVERRTASPTGRASPPRPEPWRTDGET